MEEIVGGSITEGVGGAAAIVLAILALVGVLPTVLASIAAIAIGLSLLAGGGSIAAQYSNLLTRTEPGHAAQVVGGGMTMEALCGLAGVVLGVLALLRIDSLTLLAASALIFGGALLMASLSTARLNELRTRMAAAEPEKADALSRDMVYTASGADGLIGAAAVVLGILALSGFNAMPLTLVALLCVGASILLSGTSVAGRMWWAMPRTHAQ